MSSRRRRGSGRRRSVDLDGGEQHREAPIVVSEWQTDLSASGGGVPQPGVRAHWFPVVSERTGGGVERARLFAEGWRRLNACLPANGDAELSGDVLGFLTYARVALPTSRPRKHPSRESTPRRPPDPPGA